MKAAAFTAVLLITVGGGAAAQPAPPSYTMTHQEVADRLALDEIRAKEMKILLSSASPDEVKKLLLDHMDDQTKKVINYDTGSIFLQYTAADGKSYTWYPNATQVAMGTWKIQTDSAGASSVCFQSDAKPTPNCIPAAYILSEYCAISMSKKDTYDLTSSRIPYKKALLNVPQ